MTWADSDLRSTSLSSLPSSFATAATILAVLADPEVLYLLLCRPAFRYNGLGITERLRTEIATIHN